MMKRCPECYEVYDAEQNYCDSDGHALLADPTVSLIEEPRPEPVSADPRTAWFTGIVGLMAGILICAAVYVGYSLLIVEDDSSPQEPIVTRPDREPFRRNQRPEPTDDRSTAGLTEEVSDDEAEEITEDPGIPEPPATDEPKVAVRLNRGPVSTGERRKDDSEEPTVRTVIEMKDGTEADVDAAWEDSKGVWYRRGSVVSFVESNRVKAITARAEPKTSP